MASMTLSGAPPRRERELCADNLLVQIRLVIVMIRWTGLAPWEFESLFSGSLTSTFVVRSAPPSPPTPAHCLRMNMIDSGLVGSTDFHSSHLQGYESGRGTERADDAQGTRTQSHISPSILVYEEYPPVSGKSPERRRSCGTFMKELGESG